MVTGSKRFDVFREGTDCNTVKKLVQCATNNTFYVADELVYNETQIEIGDVFSAYITNADGQQLLCLRYDSDVSGSPDSYIDSITGIHSTCGICNTDIQPTPSPSPSLTATPTLTPTNTPTSSVTASVTPTASLSPTPGVSATSTPRPTVTPSVTPTLTRTQTVTPTPTHTPTVTQSITPSVTASNTPTNTVTPSNTPTLSQSMTPSVTPTYTPTYTPTQTITATPTITTTLTPTQTQTNTPTQTVTATPTISVTSSITPTYTPTASPSDTPGVSQTATPTVTRTPTYTPTYTQTYTPTQTVTTTPTLTQTQTLTPTQTQTNTPTQTVTPTTPCCDTWDLYGGMVCPTGTTFTYVDCDGLPQEITVPIYEGATICAISVTNTNPGCGGSAYTNGNCICNPTPTPTQSQTPTPTTPCCTNWRLNGGTDRGAQFEITDCNKKTYSLFVNAYDVANVCALDVVLKSGTDATYYADASCICLSPTPTPTQSQTPTPTHTPTQTPTPTQSQTPTPTLTPSITPSITPSTSGGVPSQTHVYSACTTEIAIIISQDVPVPNVSVGQTFQYQGVCYIYVGTFNQPYVPPQGFIYSNSTTNIFGSPTVFSDCPTCNTNLNAATPTPSPMTCSLTVFNSGPATHPSWSNNGVTNLNDYKTKIANFNFYSPVIASYSESQNTGGSSSFTVNGNITFGKSFTNNSLNSSTVDSTITVGDVYAVKMCANDLNNTVTWGVPSLSANQVLTFEARDPQNQWLTGQNFVFSATTNSTITTTNGKTFYYFEAECTSATTQVNSSKFFTDNTNNTWSGEFCLTQSTVGPQFTQWNVQSSVSINCPQCTLFGPLTVVYTNSSVNALANGVVVYNNSALTTYVINGTFISDGSTIYSVGPNGVLTLECQVGLGC